MKCVIDCLKATKFLSLCIWGKPTIYYSINSAINTRIFESIIVATEDEYISYLVKVFFKDRVSIQSTLPQTGTFIDGRAANLSSELIKKIVLENYHRNSIVIMDYIRDSEERIMVDSDINFEITLIIHKKRLKATMLKGMINERINQKLDILLSNNNEKEICLIGHSQFDQWNIKEIYGIPIRNCGISGITAEEYISLILNKKQICLDNTIKIYVLIGINEIALDLKTIKITNDIVRMLRMIKDISNVPLYYIEIIPVNGRLDRDNARIKEINQLVRERIPSDVTIISTNKLQDKFGNLDYKYTTDGLHLNYDGYCVLKRILEQEV